MARVFNLTGGGGSGGIKLDHISILTPPNKKEYKSGEMFNPDGMTVKATFDNGAELTLESGFDWTPKQMTDGLENVTVSFTEGRVTATAQQPVTVTPVPRSLRVTKDPDKKKYVYKETFDPAGMEVNVVMSDGTEKAASGFTTDQPTFLTLGPQDVTIYYEEDEVRITGTYQVSVGRASVAVPTQSGAAVYSGSEQQPVWNGYERDKMTIGGQTSGTDAGPYSAEFTLEYGYQWEGGSTEPETVVWTIQRASITETPTQAGTIVFDGESHEPEWNHYDPDKLTISGETSATDAGEHTVTFTPTKNYQWSDGSTDGREVTWEIVYLRVKTPYQSGTLTYNQAVQKPVWTNYDPAHMIIGGDTEGTDANTYHATFTLVNAVWDDGGGSEMRTVDWVIGKAAGSLTAQPTEVSLGPDHLEQTVQLNKTGDGDLSVVNEASGICDADLAGSTLTVRSKDGKSGTGTVTVKMADGQNYTGAETSVTVNAAFVQVFGVVWDMSSSATALRRLTVADDPNQLVTTDIATEPTAAVGTTGGSSPFDAFMPWKGMEECNITASGTVVKSGSSSFSRAKNDTMVYIPEFGYKVLYDGTFIYYYIASKPTAEFPKHPGSGKYVGKYVTGSGNVSKSGLAPLVSQTRDQFRQGAKKKGSGWQQWGFDTWCAIVMLFIVEFADWDSQGKVGQGLVSMSSATNTGATDTMSYHTGRADGDDGKTQVMYRWIEGLWGNVRQFVDGYNANGYTTYVCLDPSQYKDGTSTGYTALGVKLPSSGYIKELGESAEFPWAFCPKTSGGSASTYIPDRVYSSSSSWHVLSVGGYWNAGSNAGLCYFSANSTTSSSFSALGSRLLYNPL